MKGKPSSLWAYTWGYNECRIGSYLLFFSLALAILKTIDILNSFFFLVTTRTRLRTYEQLTLRAFSKTKHCTSGYDFHTKNPADNHIIGNL